MSGTSLSLVWGNIQMWLRKNRLTMNYSRSFMGKCAPAASTSHWQAQLWCRWLISIIIQTHLLVNHSLSRGWCLRRKTIPIISVWANIWTTILISSKKSSKYLTLLMKSLNSSKYKLWTSEAGSFTITMRRISSSQILIASEKQSKKECSYGTCLAFDRLGLTMLMRAMK